MSAYDTFPQDMHSSSGGGGGGSTFSAFTNHVFSSTPQGKADLWNAAQYGALAVAPTVVLNRSLSWAMPEPDDETSSFVILLEIFFHTVLLFGGLVLVHRLVTFVPTYSGLPHDRLSPASLILAVLAITVSMKTKFAIKVAILADRLGEMWDGGDRRGGKAATSAGGGGGGGRLPMQPRPPAPRAPLAGVHPAGNLMR